MLFKIKIKLISQKTRHTRYSKELTKPVEGKIKTALPTVTKEKIPAVYKTKYEICLILRLKRTIQN